MSKRIFLSGPKTFYVRQLYKSKLSALTGYKIKIFINSEKCKLCSISGSIKYSLKI